MNGWIRSSRLKPLLLIVLALLLAQCGSDSEVVVKELECRIQGFEGGLYTFTVDSAVHNCPIDLPDLEGEQFGPVNLPATEELPQIVVIQGVPLVGSVEVNITVSPDGKVIRIAGTRPITIDPGITATVSGLLCPDPGSTSVDSEITIEATSALFSCKVTARATGTL